MRISWDLNHGNIMGNGWIWYNPIDNINSLIMGISWKYNAIVSFFPIVFFTMVNNNGNIMEI